MAVRVTITLLLTAWCVCPQLVRAQGYGSDQAYYVQNPYESQQITPVGDVQPSPNLPGYPAYPHSPNVFAEEPLDAPDAANTRGNIPYYGERGVTVKRVEHDYWDENGPLERALASLVHQTWVRLEYLQWDIQKPGPSLLGAPLINQTDSRFPFDVVDPQTQALIGVARVPSLDNINLKDNNGIRFTYGVPLTFGSFEARVWSLEQANERDVANDLDGDQIDFIATSTFVNGLPSDNIEVYNNSFQVDYESDLFGADLKVALDIDGYGEGLHLKPVFGLQMTGLDETVNQYGVFSQPDPFDPTRIVSTFSSINTVSRNRYWGGVIGMRAELEHRWFTLGVEPTAMLGFNNTKSTVTTVNFRGNVDGRVVTEFQETKFAPILQLSTYGRFNLSECWSLTAGYDLMWLTRAARPGEAVFYNDNGGPPIPPGVVARDSQENVLVHGFSVGAQFLFP